MTDTMDWKDARQVRPGPDILARLKKPLGLLVHGGPDIAMPKLKALVDATRPSVVVTVGDVVSSEAEAHRVRVDVRIVDNKTLRREYATRLKKIGKTFHVENPAGAITQEAWSAIRDSMKEPDRNVTIIVDGEEDLLAIPAILESPTGGLVVYGQPSEGLVVVTVTDEMKRSVDDLVLRMKKD